MQKIYLTGAVTVDETTGEHLHAGEHIVSAQTAEKLKGNPRVALREDKAITIEKPRIENKAV